MRTLMRRSGALLILAAFAVSTTAPAIAQSGSPSGVTQRQSILTELSATGVPGSSRVFTQLTVAGNGPVSVTLPGQATRGLRNLDGYQRPDVDGDDVTWQLDATPDGTSVRSVADNTADLPVSVEVAYHLDGQEVGPRDLAGRTGELEVAYTITNLTAEPRDLVAFDAQNQRSTTTEDIAVPMVGSLAVTLPPTFTGIEAPGANVAGDGRGSTVVNFSLLLFSPLGSESQTVTYAAHVSDAVVPSVTVQVLPVDDRSFTSLRSTEEAYKGAVESTLTLANGALILDSNVQLLASGAAQLLDGLEQLADGAQQLSTGLADTAAPGARELADGTGRARSGAGELSTGLGELSLGANRLSGGLGDARSGGRQLSTGLVDLADGASRIDGGLVGLTAGIGLPEQTALDKTIIGGMNSLRAGIAGLPATVQVSLEENLEQALLGIVLPALGESLEAGLESNLLAGLQDNVTPGVVAQLGPGLAAAVTDALKESVTDPVVAGLGPALDGALESALQNQVAPGLLVAIEAALADALATQLGVDPAIAAAFAAAFAAGLETPFNTAFADFAEGFGPAFATGFGPSLDDAFEAFGPVFGPAFATGFGPALDGAFVLFVTAFAPQFADGFVSLAGPSLSGFARQFAAAFAAGLDVALAEEALPGFDQLLLGLNNEACDPTDPTDPTNPCGVRQVLGLLSEGSSLLAAGSDRASDGAAALVAGLGQLDDGGKQLAAGAGRAATGGRDLASGLGLIDDGANRLADGLGDAADGSTKLAEGLSSAEEGGGKLADGTVRLSEVGMGSLISGVSDATEAASLSRARVRAVTDRGRQYTAPYGVAAGADASAVWKFEIAGVGSPDGGPSTGLLVGLALLALLAAGGLSVVLRRRLG